MFKSIAIRPKRRPEYVPFTDLDAKVLRCQAVIAAIEADLATDPLRNAQLSAKSKLLALRALEMESASRRRSTTTAPSEGRRHG